MRWSYIYILVLGINEFFSLTRRQLAEQLPKSSTGHSKVLAQFNWVQFKLLIVVLESPSLLM